jgi:hypothetical protein
MFDAKDWRARHQESLRFWCGLYPPHEARGIAWGEMENLWHQRYAEFVPPGLCVGCRGLIGGGPVLILSDRNVVHLQTLDCVIAYGERWRKAATIALKAFGLEPPAENK